MSISITINDSAVQVPDGSSVLDAVNASATYLPQLCKDPDMKAIGACRTCLVQIEGMRGLPASCSVPAADGMVVRTDTPAVQRIRSGVLELTLAMLPSEKPAQPVVTSAIRGEGQYGQLTRAARQHGIDGSRWQAREREETDTSNPVFNIGMESCILCARCVNACQEEHQFIGAIDLLGAGSSGRIGAFMDKPLLESICTTCGQCLSVCPTGAIQPKTTISQSIALEEQSSVPPLPLAEGPGVRAEKTVSTTCPYCGVGCGIKMQISQGDEIVAVEDDPDNRSSAGMLCVKGRFGASFVHHPDRLTTPLIRENGEFREASWDEALDLITDRLVNYRNDNFGTLCSAKATNEDGYIQQKFARLLMQTNNIDHCTRLCHSPSVEAMLATLGSGATSNSYTDYENAGCLVVIGCDPTSNHPVAASRMRRAVVERGAKLIVINPRRIDMCDYADLWLRPYPGTDVALMNGLARIILDEGLVDQSFVADRTEGFEDWKRIVENYPPERVEEITGVSARDLRLAARMYARPPIPDRVPFAPSGQPSDSPLPQGEGQGVREYAGSCLIWGMGITQHTNGTPNAHGLLNLALVTGQLGRPGSGVSPLRGQNNVQGCGDAGCIPDNMPGYQGYRQEVMDKFEDAWGGVPLPGVRGLVITEIVRSIAEDFGIKAMYITGENPLLSEPDLNEAAELFNKLEFLVVQDIFLHETAQIADVVLPATSFAEKDGTFTNSERRVQRIRKAVEPRGRSRPDWEIICDLGRRMCRKLDLPLEEQFTYSHPSEIFDEMARLTPILSGISYDRLEKEGGIQWPCPSPDHPGTPYLYADSFPRGPRARFIGYEQGPLSDERPSRRYPLILNTGRVLYHWHGGTMTRRVPGLLARSPDLEVSINPSDGEKFGIADGQAIRVTSRRGELTGRALFTDRMRAGEIFIPFVKLSESAANFLTNSAYDPDTMIPEYKVCAVRVDAG
ncbi:MAG: molybdopterin-dependent oxidoreductase [Chloroflexi bacterium]|nr:molybdopterin-dependent oxidoreductase [Chloroflexota bacterium]